MGYFRRYFITLKDIGLKRLYKRLGYELRKILDNYLPEKFVLFLIYFNLDKLNWESSLKNFEIKNHNLRFIWEYKKDEIISFNLLNSKKFLSFPIVWNDKDWDRLWQFNLHYFCWARNSIESYIDKGNIDLYLLKIPLLINQWIDNNPIGKGDGWHSYTISLRLRNWLWIIQTFPEIKNEKIFISMGKQLFWLYTHLEDSNGGNHYLENLCSLIIISLQFDNKKTAQIYRFALKKLKLELSLQILKDGGHEERTASYHILILERLIEVGCVIRSKNYKVPKWLNNTIKSMLNWTKSIKLRKNNFPRFNDSPIDGCPKIDNVINFANSFIYGHEISLKKLKGIRKKLISYSGENETKLQKSNVKSILNLEDTGWTIMRPGLGWEVVVKSGESGPKHLAGHTHSDLFSFDIFHNGIPIIVECGTSTYQMNKIRNYERSGQAHNVFELLHKDKVIEPIEIWSNFRAGRKAKVFNKKSGYNENGKFSITSSHDGYSRFNVSYSRELNFNLEKDSILNIEITENLITKNCMHWRSWIHLSPFIKDKEFKKLLSNLKSKNRYKFKIIETTFSYGFGKRKKRNSICFYGITKKGVNKFKLDLNLSTISQ